MSAASPFQGFTGQAYLEYVDSTGTSKTFVFDNVMSEEWTDDADITEHPVEKGPDVADHIRDQAPVATLTVHATNEPIDSNNFMTALTGPSAIQIPRPNWTPGPGVVVVPTWQNLIGLRSDIGALLGLAGGNGAVAGAVGALNVADKIGGALGISNPIFNGIEVDVPVATDAGLQPPTAAAPFNVTTQTWPAGFDFVEETISSLRNLKKAGQLFTVHGSKQTEPNMALKTIVVTRSKDEGTGATLTLTLRQVTIVETQTVSAPIPALAHTAPPSNKGAQNPSDATPAQQKSVLTVITDGIQARLKR